MAKIDFPSSPSIGDTHKVGSNIYRWNGTSWVTTGAQPSSIYAPLVDRPTEGNIVGDLFVDAGTKIQYIWSGSTWEQVTAGPGTGGGTSVSSDGVVTNAYLDGTQLVIERSLITQPDITVELSSLVTDVIFPTVVSAQFLGVGVVYAANGATTALAQGATLQITVVTDNPVDEIEIMAGTGSNNDAAQEEIFTGLTGVPVVGGYSYTINATIADRGTISTVRSVRIRAKSSNGFYTEPYDTVSGGSTEELNTIRCDNTTPSVSFGAIVYPASQQALKGAESATIVISASGYDTISHTSPTGELTITNPSTFESPKTVTRASGTYNVSTNNLQVVATKTSNGASTTVSTVIKIANADPIINITPATARLRSSPAGNDTLITIDSDQDLISVNSLNASVGIWQGSWVENGIDWERSLRISDGDTKGNATFSSLSVTNLAGKVITLITSGATYVVGGFVSRTIIFDTPAPDKQLKAIGTPVTDTSKLVVTNIAGTPQIFNNGALTDLANAFAIVDVSKTIITSPPDAATGDYVWWRDETQAITNNVSGTQSLTIEETV